MGDRSLHCGNRNSCDLDIDPITFIYELNAYSLDIHQMCKYKLPTSRFSKVIVWQTYRQTDKLRVFTSGHVTKMAVTPFDPPYPITPCTRRPDGSILSRTGVMATEVYITGIGIWTFTDPVTLTLTRWPSYTNLTRNAWRYTGRANMNFLSQGFLQLSSDRQTGTHTCTHRHTQTDRQNRPKL